MLDSRKIDLAYAYRILAHLGLDDHTYAHLSIRAKDPLYFHIYPFGQRFEEAAVESLLTVSQNGNIVEGEETHLNQTGYVIHGAIYQARPDTSGCFSHPLPCHCCRIVPEGRSITSQPMGTSFL